MPARMRVSPCISTAPNPLADKRITTPGTPPSRTSKLDPMPTTMTGTSAGKFFKKNARSASSAGWNITCAGPPTRNHVNLLISAFAVSRPRISSLHGRKVGSRSGKAMIKHLQELPAHLATHKPKPLYYLHPATSRNHQRSLLSQQSKQDLKGLQ